ncbi:MAG TPA: hypothetical protein VGK96_04720 [Candidatus Sulfotelmatobacter sp.]
MKLLVEGTSGLRAVVHRYTDDLQTALCVLLLQLDQMRSLGAARLAPACPEIQQDHSAPIGGQTKILSIQLRQREIRRGLVGDRRGCHRRTVMVPQRV